MSYLSSINNKILYNVFYNNNRCSNDLSGSNFSSINYVNTNISNINLTNQTNQLIELQNEIINLNNELNILIEKNKLVIGSITTTILLIPPPNYLFCDGSSLLVSQYQQLYNIIGYNYGGSNGSFNLPDFRNCYILGGNNNINNISMSNLFSGNGTVGATNNYAISYNVFPSTFPLLTVINQHIHQVNDPTHGHYSWSEDQPYSSIGTDPYIKQANGDGNFLTAPALTGITMQTTGSNIQQKDNISNLSGVNITPSYISCAFIICVSNN